MSQQEYTMNTKLQSIFDKLWAQYTELAPQALEIRELITQKNHHEVNDHVAFRTFQHSKLGIDQLARVFLENDYVYGEDYHFDQKKLYAKHLQHKDTPELYPKIFISELELHKFSADLNEEVEKAIAQIPQKSLSEDGFCHSGRHWDINYKTYQKLLKESEYAAWLYCFGFCANHFTISVNKLNEFQEIAELNSYLKNKGYKLNDADGEIKGSKDVFLEQSSTKAQQVEVLFNDGKHTVPSCYYEFAKRYPLDNGNLYQGFVAKSADKIFESTDTK